MDGAKVLEIASAVVIGGASLVIFGYCMGWSHFGKDKPWPGSFGMMFAGACYVLSDIGLVAGLMLPLLNGEVVFSRFMDPLFFGLLGVAASGTGAVTLIQAQRTLAPAARAAAAGIRTDRDEGSAADRKRRSRIDHILGVRDDERARRPRYRYRQARTLGIALVAEGLPFMVTAILFAARIAP